ncbi:hypothetical protein [Acidovorax sp. SUPP2539]|uniref:hypothetical protein n=1 Tax=Acidovorax sp. SUPP2539 TaxID=2920878 RepID=UPI0023DE3439|nr:hypothetical protein [Acidovorax sp. SUPP2539]GKS89245.1 type III secretion system chaperone [Acidovorax sp. SUPP2539]
MSAVLTSPAGAPPLAQELEASPRVLSLIKDLALLLGASSEQAREASRTGTIALESRSVALLPDADEQALILAAPLPADCLDDPARRVAALRASTRLILQFGIVFARGFSGPQLLCRCPLASASLAVVGQTILQLAALANAVQAGAASTGELALGQAGRSHGG